MNRAIVLLPLLVACNGYQGQFLLTFPGMATTASTTEVSDYNFVGAQPIAEDPTDPTPSDWTTTDETTTSPSLSIIEIVTVEGGDPLLVTGGEIFPGTKDGGVYTFSWTSFEDTDETDAHTSGYHVGRLEHDAVVTTIHFNPNDATGDISFEQVNEWTIFETDEYDYNEIGSSDIYEVSYYLEMADGGYVQNDADAVDCGDADCRLTVSESSSYSGTFTSQEVAHDGFSGAGQD